MAWNSLVWSSSDVVGLLYDNRIGRVEPWVVISHSNASYPPDDWLSGGRVKRDGFRDEST